uniref:DUF5666 domain-containing protein n=1 Tax=Salinispora arenicola (strain CNS-205) TaxID=391037 RepID=A8LXU3_SALAI
MTTDLATALAAETRPWRNRATPWLAAAVLLVGGFAAGAQTHHAYGPEPVPAAAGRGAGTEREGGGGRGARGGEETSPGTPATQPVVTGTVTHIDGDTLRLRRESGETVTVRVDDRTQVRLPGTVKDLETGDTVSVAGTADGDSVAATNITTQE